MLPKLQKTAAPVSQPSTSVYSCRTQIVYQSRNSTSWFSICLSYIVALGQCVRIVQKKVVR